MKKLRLEDRARRAWAVVVAKHPDYRFTYGEDGWEVWQRIADQYTYEEAARLFGMALTTAYRWERERKGEVV